METGDSSESPSQTKTKAAKKPEASSLKQRKCLYTTVRERVENSLDSAESISELPVVEVTVNTLLRKPEIKKFKKKNVALGKKVKETSAVKAMKGRGEASFYRVTYKDNGRGMPHDDIPNMLGWGSDLVKDEYRPSDGG